MQKLNPSSLAAAGGVLYLFKAFQSLTAVVKGFGQSSINNFSHFESMQKGLETYFQSAQKGKAVFEDLRVLSNETTFGVDELASASTQLLNTGTSVSQLNDTLLMLGNAAQGNKQSFAELTSIFSKIQSTGKAGSEQLQMLATRGLPIYNILKKLGVQGVASAEDIKKAFQEMTQEGGQFYNAMNNINETIEGKLGIISDFTKELQVNFANVTGLADAYKSVVDSLATGIEGLSGWLLELDKNPVMKSIFTGALVGGLTLIASIIGVTMLGAIKKLNTQLGITVALKSILDPKTLGIAVAVAGIAGLAVGVARYTQELKKTNEELLKLKENGSVKIEFNLEEIKIKSFTEQIKNIEKEYENSLLRANSSYLAEARNAFANAGGFTTNAKLGKLDNDENYKVAKANYERAKELALQDKGVISAKQKLDLLKQQLGVYQKIKSSQEQAQESVQWLDDMILSMKSKNEQDLQTVLDNIEKVKKLDQQEVTSEQITDESLKKSVVVQRFFELYPNSKLSAETLNVLLNKQAREIRVKIAIENAEEWKKDLVSRFGLNPEEAIGKDGSFNLNNIMKAINDKSDFLTKKSLLGSEQTKLFNDLNMWLSGLGGILEANKEGFLDKNGKRDGYEKGKWIDDLINSFMPTATKNLSLIDGKTGITATDEDKQTLSTIEQILKVLEQLAPNNASVASLRASYKNTSDNINGWDGKGGLYGYGQSLKANGEKKATDAFAQFHKTGKAEDYVQGMFSTEGLGDYAQGKVLGEFMPELMNKFDSMIDTSTNQGKAAQVGVKALNGILQGQNVWQALISALMDSLLGWIQTDIQNESELEKLDAIKEQLQEMNKSIKDQLTYMHEVQLQMQANFINRQISAGSLTKVNDMILTPHGNFSTAPDDYLIATKNPHALGNSNSANVQVQVVINNTASNDVQTDVQSTQDANGIQQLLVTISKKVANDASTGTNGWDSALTARENRIRGRSLA